MIDTYDVKRIQGDVTIAIDALEGLLYSPVLTSDYISEKCKTVRNCLEFIESFSEGEDDKH